MWDWPAYYYQATRVFMGMYSFASIYLILSLSSPTAFITEMRGINESSYVGFMTPSDPLIGYIFYRAYLYINLYPRKH